MAEQEARDDERDALVKAFADAIFEAGLRTPESTKAVIALKTVLAARKHPEPEITDDMIDRAAMALTGLRKSQWEEARAEAAGGTDYYLDAARTALEAAFRVPVGEREQ